MNRLAERTPVGDYTIQRFIKEGLYNDNYIVNDSQGKLFFLKRFDLASLPERMKLSSGVAEIVVSRKIDHPNVASHVADGEMSVDGVTYPYLVMPFYQGSLLSERLQSGRIYTPEEVRRIMVPVLEGLVYLHARQISHNDISPRNILLEEVGEDRVIPRIIDLGHAWTPVTRVATPFPVKDLNLLYLPPEALKVTLDDVDWNCHAAQPFEDMKGAYSYRIELMHTQIKSAFGTVPEKLEDFVAASQFVQAEAMKFFLESFRLRKPVVSGLIWWNVIDCWPQISDAVVDYYYRKKPAYYYLKASQQLVCLMCREPKDGMVEVVAVNDRLTSVAGTYRVTELGVDGVLLAGEFRLEANGGATTLGAIAAGDYQVKPRFLQLEWSLDGEAKKCHNHYLLGKAPYRLEEYQAMYEAQIALYKD